MDYDFSGWATKNNIRCSDGRVIKRDAFKDCDGVTVPLVWDHKRVGPQNVLGHALLENRDEGVYAYCSFNDSENGELAKTLVKHGDISALSIFANRLKQRGSDVVHGMIREVSLVYAGANPGAFIDTVIAHGDDGGDGDNESAAIIYTGEEFSLRHSDDKKDDEKEDDKKDDTKSEDDETVEDVFKTLSEKQKKVVYAMIGMALEDGKSEDEENNNKTNY